MSTPHPSPDGYQNHRITKREMVRQSAPGNELAHGWRALVQGTSQE